MTISDDQLPLYDTLGDEYDETFRQFLQHTDQKATLHEWLLRLIPTLPARKHLLDIGAGEGTLTVKLAPFFDRTTVVEPSTAFHPRLREKLPDATILPQTIDEALNPRICLQADFLICSHVLYHVADWLKTLRLFLSQLTAGDGIAVLVLQSAQTDSDRTNEHFFGSRESSGVDTLPKLAANFLELDRTNHKVSLETLPSYVETEDLETLSKIVELFIEPRLKQHANVQLTRQQVKDYLAEHHDAARGYRFSVHQDVLTISAPKSLGSR